ncbi:FMN-binding protein [Ramlibacter sp. G-1-2-2]|uniref:FMN-binding protein n=1 Tax=Ramlibacter agri TaxID=2728837 RepID=A0A848H6W2_9BURK|nr:FMN-binding protein [Ramlibacter agri]NML46716.1 FMN-binding protein [Ramlibacter agri]
MPTRRHTLRRGAALGLGAGLWNSAAFAAVYLDIEQARKLLLPEAASFQSWPLALDGAALAAIAQDSHTRVPPGFAPAGWTGLDAQGKPAGWVLADRVTGKYELIDYAVGFAPDGAITGVEVLAYRESHGSEIRNLAWRRQFVGHKGPAQLRFGEDIRSISGATLSCQHVTEGVQRLSALVALQGPHK